MALGELPSNGSAWFTTGKLYRSRSAAARYTIRMPQDGWRRAYILSRSRQGTPPSASSPVPPRPRSGRQRNWGCIAALVLLLLLAAAAVALWLYRWWWVPRYRERLPDPVRQALPEPRASIDLTSLDAGLGCQLRQFSDYLPLIDATRAWGVEWELAETGGGTTRLSAPGLLVYTRDGLILTYDLDLRAVYANARWVQWQPLLRQAGLSLDLTYTALTGKEDMPAGKSELEYDSANRVELKPSPARGKYILHFTDGWLTRVVAAVNYGAAP
jgi:hypothetical protein